MAKVIKAGFTGEIHANLTGRPGLVGREVQRIPKVRTVVRKPPYDGSKLWAMLHRRALTWTGGADDAWLGSFRAAVPCGDCRKHWDGMLAVTPPDWSNYFRWSVDRHNEVNRRLGKPVMDDLDARLVWGSATPG